MEKGIVNTSIVPRTSAVGRIKDLLANEVPSINDYGLVVYTSKE